jgi:hypothetical protein
MIWMAIGKLRSEVICAHGRGINDLLIWRGFDGIAKG